MSAMEEDSEARPTVPAADAKAEALGENRAIDQDNLDKDIEAQRALARQDGKLNKALENLLTLEKQMRLAADVVSTRKVVLAIIQICYEAKAWKVLNEHIMLLAKRRAQLKQAITAMVQEAMTYIDATPDLETRMELIKTLNNVTAGKIYVEIERARLTKKLAKIKEDQGEVKEAAEIMQEVAVETFGAMAKTEKIAFILEQARLCLDHKDYMRAQILAKKINPRVFTEEPKKEKKKGREMDATVVEAAAPDIPSLPELKQIYYELMISMQSSLLHSTYEERKLRELPKFRSLLKLFITMEVVNWPHLATEYRYELEEQNELFGGEAGGKPLETLRQRVIEHNILVISKYYTRIHLKRLSELLDLPMADTEKHLSEMVVSRALYAKVDRPASVVSFQGRKDSNEVLNTWSISIEKLLDLVEKSCHQIHKETMVHKVNLKVN
eukprot:SM000310S11950  [mRNA]  locus=s310:33224:37105:- [translate_table: standard]